MVVVVVNLIVRMLDVELNRWRPLCTLMVLCGILPILIGGVPNQAAASDIGDWDLSTTTTLFIPVPSNTWVSNDPNIELLIEVGYNHRTYGGNAYTVFVEVSSKALFTGQIVVSQTDNSGTFNYNSPRIPISKSVEIAAGTTHQFTFTLTDVPPSQDTTIYVELRSRDDNNSLVAQRAVNLLSVTNLSNVELVGVFPSIASQGLPSSAPLSFGAGSAVLEPIDPASLRTDRTFLQPFDIIVVTANDLNSMEEEQLDLLLSWVNTGGSLLVDELPGTSIPAIPQVWHPDSLRPVMAGQGEILLTNGLAGYGNWHQIIEPTPIKYPHKVVNSNLVWRQLVGRHDPIVHHSSPTNISEPLFEDSGFSLPNVFAVILVFVVYVVIAGPVMWFSLKRRNRRELIWVGIPILAIILSLGLWTFGSNFRGNIKSVHVSMVDVSPRGSVSTSYLLSYSPTGDNRSISQPHGWSAVPIFGYGQSSYGDAVETVNDKSSTVEFTLSPGEFFVLGSRGVHTEFDNALEVAAELHGDGRITGTVANNLPARLYDIVVYANDQFATIPEIPPRDAVQFDTFATRSSTTRQNSDILALSEQGLWNELSYRHLSLSTYLSGQAVVTALTDELDTPLDGGKADGYTLLVARGPVETADPSAGNPVASHKLVGSASNLSNEFLLRFIVPEDTTNQDAVLTVAQDVFKLSLWVAGAWHDVDLNSLHYIGTTSEDTMAVFQLPVGSHTDGRVYVKASARGSSSSKQPLVGVRTLRAGDILSPEPSYMRQ